MKILKTLLFLLLLSSSFEQVNAQVKSDAKLQYENATYTICTLKIDSNSINGITLVQNKSYLNHADFISEYTSNHDSVFLQQMLASVMCMENQ